MTERQSRHEASEIETPGRKAGRWMEMWMELEEALLDWLGERPPPGLSLRHEISGCRVNDDFRFCRSGLAVLFFETSEQGHLSPSQLFVRSQSIGLEIVAFVHLKLDCGLNIAKGVLRLSVTGPRKSVADELEAMLLAGEPGRKESVAIKVSNVPEAVREAVIEELREEAVFPIGSDEVQEGVSELRLIFRTIKFCGNETLCFKRTFGHGSSPCKENGQPKLTVIFAFEASCWVAASQELSPSRYFNSFRT
jgi:hypothetical protein